MNTHSLFGGFAPEFSRFPLVAATALNLTVLHAKSREFRPQNYTNSLPHETARRNGSAQTHSKNDCRRAMHSCALRLAFAGAGRVSRAKIAPKFGDTFAISTEITVDECKFRDKKHR